jgi:oxygen-independent coproporphyrinogen-3 oxidase
MLESRLADGLDVSVLGDGGRRAAPRLAADGLLDAAALDRGRIVLTLDGRLLADAVARELVD